VHELGKPFAIKNATKTENLVKPSGGEKMQKV